MRSAEAAVPPRGVPELAAALLGGAAVRISKHAARSPRSRRGIRPRSYERAMTVKRRSHGRNKKGRGHVNRVRCVSTGKAIPKDKAIKRFIVRNIVDASSMRDIRDASAYDTYDFCQLDEVAEQPLMVTPARSTGVRLSTIMPPP